MNKSDFPYSISMLINIDFGTCLGDYSSIDLVIA